MFTFKKFGLATIVVAGMSSMAMAGHDRSHMKRVTVGPRSDVYVWVPADRFEQRERPYALTGSERDAAERREAKRPAPQHLKGPRGNY